MMSTPIEDRSGGLWRCGVARWGLVLAVSVAMGWAGGVPAAAQEGKKKTEGEEKVVLREAEDKALRAFVTKLAEAKRKLYEVEMKGLAERVARETELAATAVARLEEGFAKAIDATMTGWDEKAFDWLAPFVGRSPNAMREMARWPVDQIAKSPGVKDVTAPDEQPVWRSFLKSLLSEKQWAVWEAKLAQDARELEARSAEFVQFAAENQRPAMEAEMDLVVADIGNAVALPAERAGALKKLAGEAVTQALKEWEKAALKSLRSMERERREAVMTHGGGMAPEEEIVPQTQPRWEEGLKALLTAEEQKQVEVARAVRKARRVEASRRALLLILDEQVGLTAAQRKALLPRLSEAAGKLTEQMRRYYNLEPYAVSAVLRECDAGVIREVLEASQHPGLERLMNPKGRAYPDEDAIVMAREKPAPATDAELERVLSSDLMRRYDEAAQERMTQMETHLADLGRHVALTPAQTESLRLAARGAVQDSLAMFRTQVGTWLRQSMAGATAEGVHHRLVTLGTAGFGNEESPQETVFWRATLARVLESGQKARWQEALAAREAELRETQVLLVLSELDQQLALTPAQAAFFEKELKTIIRDYAVDLDEYNGARRWHLQAYSMLTPVMGIGEELIKQHLSPGQMELWLEKSASQVKHYWQGVQRKHEARLEEEAKAAKTKTKGKGKGDT